MNYQEHHPAPGLIPFIDCYWTLQTDLSVSDGRRRQFPDICTDLLVNLGEDVQIWNGENTVLRSEKPYLMGAMTSFNEIVLRPGIKLTGIRFKPFGASALLNIPQNGMANKIEELSRRDFSLDCIHFHDLLVGKDDPRHGTSAWLSRRADDKDNTQVNAIIETILESNGQISVRKIAPQFNLTERQLERRFAFHLGVPLKEICNLVRFQYALQLINNRQQESLLDIAFRAGYYDHAHLTRHFKRYAGLVPSQLRQ